MGRAKDELREAVETLDEPDAELVLSLLHLHRYLSSRSEDAGSAAELLAVALLSERLRGNGELRRLLRAIVSDRQDLAWTLLGEQGFTRDWDSPEEDEAWADL